MKLLVALLGFSLAAGSVLAQVAPKPPAPGAPVPPAKKEEAMGKITGTEIARPNGNWLGLEVVGGNFKLTFYDKKKKPVAVDVSRVAVRWENKRSGTPSDYRTVLNGTGTYMTGGRAVLPPLAFTVWLTLLRGEGDNAQVVETYTIPFRG